MARRQVPRQPPSSDRTGRARPAGPRGSASSSARRLFPIPGSPEMSTKRPLPSEASASETINSSSSRSRPTNVPTCSFDVRAPGFEAARTEESEKTDPGSAPPARGRAARDSARDQAPNQRTAGIAVGLEGLGLPSAAVERQHEVAPQTLSERVLGWPVPRVRQRAGRDGRARDRRRCDPPAPRAAARPASRSPSGRRAQTRSRRERARARGRALRAEGRGGALRIAPLERFAAGDALSSSKLRRSKRCAPGSWNCVTRRPGHDHPSRRPRQIRAACAGGRRGRTAPCALSVGGHLAPQEVDQAIGRDSLVRMQQQDGEESALSLGRGSATRLSCRADLERLPGSGSPRPRPPRRTYHSGANPARSTGVPRRCRRVAAA